MSQPSHVIWIALSLVLLLLGLSLGNVLFLTAAVFVLLTTLLTTALPPSSGIVVERELSRAVYWVGDTLWVRRNLSAERGIGPIFVHDDLPTEAEVVQGSNLRVVWKWPGRLSVDISYQVRFPKRGLYILPEYNWESRAPFGVKPGISGVSGSAFELSVVPRIRNVTLLNDVRVVRRIDRRQENLSNIGASTNEFRELRPYQPGDSFKRINWKASARLNSADNVPLVNDLEPESSKAVWIFLDIANYMDVGTPLSNPLENTIEASGTLAQYYLSRGATLGAYAYNSSRGIGELLAPETGKRQFNRLMGMLTGLEPGTPGQDLLQSVKLCKSFLYRIKPEVFIITRLDVQYVRPGEDTVGLERFKTAVRELASLRPRSVGPSRVQVVHVEPQESAADSNGLRLTRWETAHVARELREKGAYVIEWKPEREEFTSVLVRYINAYK